MTSDASPSSNRSAVTPAGHSFVRTATGAIVLATIASGGCQTASSGSWSTKNQSMSVEKRQELARQREDARLPVPEIAEACGFAYAEHMIPLFARHHGATPAAFRRNLRGRAGTDPLRPPAAP